MPYGNARKLASVQFRHGGGLLLGALLACLVSLALLAWAPSAHAQESAAAQAGEAPQAQQADAAQAQEAAVEATGAELAGDAQAQVAAGAADDADAPSAGDEDAPAAVEAAGDAAEGGPQEAAENAQAGGGAEDAAPAPQADQGGDAAQAEDETPAPVESPAGTGAIQADDGQAKPVQGSSGAAGAQATSWQRLSGANALGTMREIVKKGFSKSDVVLLASSEGWWDALAACSLAGVKKAPVLLTKPGALSAEAQQQITRLGATKAYVCGGTAAVSRAVDAALARLGVGVTRLAGQTAVGTAIAIAREVGAEAGDTCVVATVGGYWDALSASPYAYAKAAPIFLSNTGSAGLSADTQAAIRQLGFSKAVITGGTAAVPGKVESQLQGIGVRSVTRLGGANAYDTSALVANFCIKQGMSADRMGVATGRGYWDAITGAALCGANNAVIVLADDNNRSAIDKVYYTRTPSVAQGYVFGGPVAVTKLTWDYLHHRAADGKVVPSAGALADGQVYAVFAQGRTLVLDVPNSSEAKGTQMQLHASSGNQAQKFVARDLGGGYYGLQSLASRLYLAMSGGKLVQVAKSGAASQKWAIMPATAGVAIVNLASGTAVAYPQAAKTAKLVGAKLDGAASQRFSFQATDPVNPGYYVVYNARGKALTVTAGNPYAAGANVDVRSANGSGEQVFCVVKKGQYYQIVNSKSYKAVGEAGKGNGANVQQQNDTASAAQLWKVTVDKDGYLVFTNRASGKNMDVAGNSGANGANVQIYGASGGTGQQWRIAPTSRYTLSGNDELDAWIRTAVNNNGNNLRSCFNWAIRSFGAVHEVDSRRPWGIQSNKVSIDYALIAKRRGVADCYVNAALFNWLARGCGYSANFRAGAVPSVSQGRAAHGWTEIYRNGTTYICDVNLARAYTGMNWYMLTYANAPIAYYL